MLWHMLHFQLYKVVVIEWWLLGGGLLLAVRKVGFCKYKGMVVELVVRRLSFKWHFV